MATFITSKTSGQWLMQVHVRTTSGWWTYTHNGVTNPILKQAGQFDYHDIQVQSNEGEFTIISCDSSGNPNGQITWIYLQDDNITSFDGTGLSNVTYLHLGQNQLTQFDGTGLSSLTTLTLDGNQIYTISNLPTTLTNLTLGGNLLDDFDGTGLSDLSILNLAGNPLLSFNASGLSNLTQLYLSDCQLTEFDGTGLSNLTRLYLSDNQINAASLILPVTLNYLEINNNNFTSSDNDSVLSLLAENASNLNITGGEFYTTGPRTSVGNESYNTLVNDLSWIISGAYLQTLLTFKTFNTSSPSEFSPQNAVVNFDPSTKTWSVWGMQQSGGGGMIGGMDWVEIGNIGTLSSIDNGDGTWQVIYEFEYNYPSSYSWFAVRSSDGDTLQITTELIEFSASATGVNYNGDVNQLNFVLQDQWYGETLLSGTLSSTETAVGVYDLVYTFSAPSIVNIANPSIAIFENYGGENQTSIMSSIVVTAEQTTTTTTTTEEQTTTTTTTSGSTPTFTTSKAQGDSIYIDIVTSTGWWKVEHDNNILLFNGSATWTVGSNGDFTIWSVDGETGEPSGNITSLNLDGQNITYFNGSLLTNLGTLRLQNNGLTSIANFVFPPSLVYLTLVGNQLQPFDFSALTSLEELRLDYNDLTSVDNFVFPSNLLQLGLEGNGLTSFDGTSLTNLTNLYLANNGITSLVDFIFPTNLTNLHLNSNGLTSFDGTGLSNLSGLYLWSNQLTSFVGTGLSNLLELGLQGNQLASFVGTGLSNLTILSLDRNPLISFDGSGMTSLISLQLAQCGITSLENFTFPSSLTDLNFFSGKGGNNYISSFDPSGLPNLISLELSGNPMTPEANDFILDKLEAAGLSYGGFFTSNGRTSAGDSDFVSLKLRSWNLQGAGDEPVQTTTTTTTEDQTTTTTTTSGPIPTFVTSKSVGEVVFLNVNSSTGYWKYYHNDIFSGVYGNNWDGNGNPVLSEILNANGEFTIIPCDSEGNESGHLTGLGLWDNQLTSFDGTGLSSLEGLNLGGNQLTSFNGTGLSGLTFLALDNNAQLTTIDFTDLSNLNSLNLRTTTSLENLTISNLTNLSSLLLSDSGVINLSLSGLTNLNGMKFKRELVNLTNLETISLSNLSTLSNLYISNSNLNSVTIDDLPLLNSFNIDNGTCNLTNFSLTNVPLLSYIQIYNTQTTSIGVFDIPSLTSLVIVNNPNLTSVTLSGLTSLVETHLYGNQLSGFDGSNLSATGNTYLYLQNNQINNVSNVILNENIKYVSLNNNGITGVTTSDLTGFLNLNSLSIGDNSLQSYDFTSLVNLELLYLTATGIQTTDNLPTNLLTLDLAYNNISSLDVSNLPNLIKLYLYNNNISDFNSISGLTSNLIELDFSENLLTNIDITGLSSLGILNLSNNPLTPQVNDSILDKLELYGLSEGNFSTSNGRTAASTSDYDTLISRGWNISGADLSEETTTTTTTVAPPITDYALTFRKISYGDNSPKNAPLTISEFEGNFAYLSDYVNHLLGVIDGLNVTVTNLQSENQSLSNRVTNIENGGANN